MLKKKKKKKKYLARTTVCPTPIALVRIAGYPTTNGLTPYSRVSYSECSTLYSRVSYPECMPYSV